MTSASIDLIAVFGLGPHGRHAYASELAFALRAEYAPMEIGQGLSTEDALSAVLDRLQAAGVERAVFDVSEEALLTEVIGTAAGLGYGLAATVSVVDASMIEALVNTDASLTRVHDDGDGAFEVPLAVLVSSQMEYSSQVVLVGESADDSGVDFLRTLGPEAEVARWDGRSAVPIPSRVCDASHIVPGWLHYINGDLESRGRVSAFRYERDRAFHPGRLLDLLENGGEWASLLRVAGFARLASRPGVLCLWEQTGQTINIDPYETDWWADPEDEHACAGACDSEEASAPILGQDIVAIGVDLDVEAMVKDLDSCLLTDEEFLDGVWAWVTYEDAFPA